MLVSTKLSEISKIREHLGQLGACLRRLGRVLKSAKYFWPSTDELVAWIDRGRLTTLPKGAKLMCGLADEHQDVAMPLVSKEFQGAQQRIYVNILSL